MWIYCQKTLFTTFFALSLISSSLHADEEPLQCPDLESKLYSLVTEISQGRGVDGTPLQLDDKIRKLNLIYNTLKKLNYAGPQRDALRIVLRDFIANRENGRNMRLLAAKALASSGGERAMFMLLYVIDHAKRSEDSDYDLYVVDNDLIEYLSEIQPHDSDSGTIKRLLEEIDNENNSFEVREALVQVLGRTTSDRELAFNELEKRLSTMVEFPPEVFLKALARVNGQRYIELIKRKGASLGVDQERFVEELVGFAINTKDAKFKEEVIRQLAEFAYPSGGGQTNERILRIMKTADPCRWGITHEEAICNSISAEVFKYVALRERGLFSQEYAEKKWTREQTCRFQVLDPRSPCNLEEPQTYSSYGEGGGYRGSYGLSENDLRYLGRELGRIFGSGGGYGRYR